MFKTLGENVVLSFETKIYYMNLPSITPISIVNPSPVQLIQSTFHSPLLFSPSPSLLLTPLVVGHHYDRDNGVAVEMIL